MLDISHAIIISHILIKRAVDVSLLTCQNELPTVHLLFKKSPANMSCCQKHSIISNKFPFSFLHTRFYHSILTYNVEFREFNLPTERKIYLYIH